MWGNLGLGGGMQVGINGGGLVTYQNFGGCLGANISTWYLARVEGGDCPASAKGRISIGPHMFRRWHASRAAVAKDAQV